MSPPRIIVACCLLLYLSISLSYLSVFPPVAEDEPWIAAAPYKLATEGVYGSDLFAGYYGVDRHNYQQMPLYPLVQAGIFRMAGIGVLQMRVLPVVCGLLLLLAVFLVGRQVGGESVGALAVLLMVAMRIAAGNDATGILLLDRARINRNDIAVPIFGLLALAAFNRTPDAGTRWCFLAGFLAGLSSLTHLYGVFWLVIFVAASGLGLAVRGRRGLWLLLAGFGCTWLPWLVFIGAGWADYQGQMRFVADRFDVFNPAFYISNVMDGNGPVSLRWAGRTLRAMPVTRVGTWTMVVGVPIALGVLLWQSRRRVLEKGSCWPSRPARRSCCSWR